MSKPIPGVSPDLAQTNRNVSAHPPYVRYHTPPGRHPPGLTSGMTGEHHAGRSTPRDHEPDACARHTDDNDMVASRRVLPATRDSVTHKFSVGGHEGYLTIGLYDDGSPGEIFLKISKEGSAISGFCQAFCLGFSLAIQHGLTLQEAVDRFRGMRFEPCGQTANPDIPEADSIVDYVARYLEQTFIDASAGMPRRR